MELLSKRIVKDLDKFLVGFNLFNVSWIYLIWLETTMNELGDKNYCKIFDILAEQLFEFFETSTLFY